MPKRFWSFLLLITLVGRCGIFPSFGAEDLFSKGGDTDREPWDIEALELTYDQDTDLYTAVGEVVIQRGQRTLKCDYAQVNRKTMMALAKGHVEFSGGGDELRGDEVTVDLNKQTGEIKKGRLFMKKNNFHVTGEEIHKTGESTYRVINGTLTSCDGDEVPWEIRAKELTVTIEGYGQAWHSSLRVKNTPILYLPYFIFPAKTKRQSGFLIPSPGYSSRDGVTLTLPFYWVLSDQTDATFYEHFMSRRGFMQGAEFRYVLSSFSKGVFMMDYLFKDGVSQEEFEKNKIHAPYSNRYWFRSKINQRLPWNMDLKMDLDWVSDQDYLKEFRGTANGLDSNRSFFLSEFSRSLEDETLLSRKNAAVFSKSFQSYNFSGGFTYYRELGGSKGTLNQLPYAHFDGLKQVLWKDLYYQWNSSYYHYWRETLDRGQVLDLTPALYYPLRLKNTLKMETALGLTETVYQVSNKQSEEVKELGSRAVPNLRMDLSTDIQKVFLLSGEKLQKIKHNIRPQVIYNYTPEIAQEGLPSFVSKIGKVNTLSYYLTNTLTSKSLVKKGEKGEDLFTYRDFTRLRLYQTYDFNEARKEVSGTETRKPFSNVYGELEFVPYSNLSWRSSLGWSPYSNQFDTHSHHVSYWDKKGHSAYVEYYSGAGNLYRQINSGLTWKVNPSWSASFLNRYSLDQNKNYETTLGVTYQHQCWGIKVHYSNTPDDQKFIVSVSLKGLGEF
ncbi:MAG: LPS assembly protein LptD [Thermodesulfobacteriota bacterium]